MSQTTQEGPEIGHLPAFRIDIGTTYLPSLWFSSLPVVILAHSTRHTDDPRNAPQSESNQTPWGGPSLSDSSDPLFSMYNKMAEEEDNKMVERWKADADGILIFVSSGITLSYTTACINHKITDWFVLCICGYASRSIRPGPQARSPRDLRILSRKYIPTVCRSFLVLPSPPFDSGLLSFLLRSTLSGSTRFGF